MATRLKTVEFAHPVLAALTDNTLTSLTQITVYLPETGTKTFRSVTATVSAMGTATATGNVTTRQLQCRLGAAGYTTHTNSNLYTGSGEDIFVFHEVDLTSHFTTNWSGTSMTFDSQVLLDGTATGIAWTNVNVTLSVTYEYDDTSTTQIKTVRIPLNAPVTNLATSKPGTAVATIPDLSTELPEASKTFRSTHIVVQGNVNRAGTTDLTFTQQLDSTASHTTGVYEGVSNSDFWFRYVWDCSAVLNTSASMGYYIWANATDFNHLQVWLVVTYEFDASTSTALFNSLLLPMELDSPLGSTTSSDFTRGKRDVWIEEPGTITTKQVAFFPVWDAAAALTGLNMRIGTGSFVAYTDIAANLCGGNGAMVRNDAAFTLARGRNTINFDAYCTVSMSGWNLGGFWIVNYTSDMPSDGPGAASHTVRWGLGITFDGAAGTNRALSALAPTIPEANYFLSGLGHHLRWIINSTGISPGLAMVMERLSAEGGSNWEFAYIDSAQTDAETGLRQSFSQTRDDFKRWPNDQDSNRMDIESARRYKIYHPGIAVSSFFAGDMLLTYHSIQFTVAGDITGSAGGTVTINLHRAETGEIVDTTTRSGNGAFSFTWYDDVEEVFVSAYEDGTHLGRSDNGVAA